MCIQKIWRKRKCELCEFSLKITEEGLVTNDKCGIIYKDIVISLLNGDIMSNITIVVILQDVVCQ